jgi:hypothetical protein
MSFYLSNADLHPTGVEPAEFIDVPLLAAPELEVEAWEAAATTDPANGATRTDGVPSAPE